MYTVFWNVLQFMNRASRGKRSSEIIFEDEYGSSDANLLHNLVFTKSKRDRHNIGKSLITATNKTHLSML